MLKYLNTQVTFAEVPDEITLCINITGCKNGCKNCHSPYLAEDIGTELTFSEVKRLIKNNSGISCIAFMGGDIEPKRVDALASFVTNHLQLKAAWYSGRQELSKDIELRNFDYIKLGPYIEERGPLSSRTTNQRLYRVEPFDDVVPGDYCLIDITDKFWK